MNKEFSSTHSNNNSNAADSKSTKYLSRFISNENISNLSCPDVLEDILKSAEEEISTSSILDNFLSRLNNSTSSILDYIHKLKKAGITVKKKCFNTVSEATSYLKSIDHRGLIPSKINFGKLSDLSRRIYKEDIDPTVLLLFVKKHKFIIPVPVFIVIGSIVIFNNIATTTGSDAIYTAADCKSVVSVNLDNEIGPLTENKKPVFDNQIMSDYNFYSYYDIYSTNNAKNKVIDKNALNNILSSENKKKAADSSTKTNKNAASKAPKSIISRSAEQREDTSDIIKSSSTKMQMVATAYDLSVKSCGKSPSHPAYGITKTGTRATIGRTIAVDPSIIPLRSKVYISFPEAYKNLNGIYIAEDTGSKIKGNKIDIFFGEDSPGDRTVNSLARKFGVQVVNVYVLD
ncbi:MAG TPA: 3D domain-containing protein [Pseudobacteroides sp.]|uniref:3D domain-containing protein n=1 Tax=Pseudobacteroides sp. TaxID=1968840 RepID=UPI002F939C41